MNKVILRLIIVLCAVSVNAQTKQHGVVKEYNEKEEKTPLSEVELLVSKAPSTISDKDGNFTLEFLTLKPGEHVSVNNIEKQGYEIFNKEAIEQWNINPKDPFVVIMCRSDKLKAIRDLYESKASENYRNQYNEEIDKLKKLKLEGKIKEEEYQKSLQEIKNTYVKQLDNLDNYIDRFVRIDISELSITEQEFFDMIQNGDIDLAIKGYEDLKISEKLKKEFDDRNETRKAIARLMELEKSKTESIDSLMVMGERHINSLMMQGGRDNNKKVLSIYREVASLDSTNVDWMLSAGKFAIDYIGDYSVASDFLKAALDNALVQYGEYDPMVAKIYNEFGNLYRNRKEYDGALDYYGKALNIREKIFGSDHPEVAISYRNIGVINNYQGEYGIAWNFFKMALDILRKNPMSNELYIQAVYESMGNVNFFLKNYEKALEYHTIVLKGRQNERGLNHPEIAESYSNIAADYKGLEEFDKAMEYYNQALDIWENTYGDVHPDEANAYYNIGEIHYLRRDYQKALEYFNKSLDIWETTYGPDDMYVASSYNNIGQVYDSLKEFEKALDYYQKALKIYIIKPSEHNEIIEKLKNHIASINQKLPQE